MKKEVLMFVFEGFADWESAYVGAKINESEEYVVKTVSVNKVPKNSMAGFKVIPDYTIENYPKEFAMLLLIGGQAWQEKKNDEVKNLVDYAVTHQIPVGAICGATFFLAECGYLDSRKHTSNTLEFLKHQVSSYKGEGYYREKQAVSDNGIITANGTATLEFSREVLKLLQAMPEDKIEEWYQFHKQGFYKN